MATPLKKCQSYSAYPATQYVEQPTIIKKFPKKKTKKKGSGFIGFVKIALNLAFIGAVGYYIVPANYFQYIEPMYVNRYLNKNVKYDVSEFIHPTKNYLYNSTISFTPNIDTYNEIHKIIKNKTTNLLVPTNTKARQMAPIVSNGINTALQRNLINVVNTHKYFNTSIYVYDVTSGKEVNIAGETSTPVASMIKIPILFELFRQIDNKKFKINDKIIFDKLYKTSGSGNLQYGSDGYQTTLDNMANLMITESDNSATNLILDYIGGKDSLNRSFRNWGLEHSLISNWLPDLEGTNKMSAKDLATVLYNLDNPMFLSVRSREYIKDYMSNVKTDSLLPQGLDYGAIIYHKTGDIGTTVGDAGIIYTNSGKKYIAVIVVKRAYNDHRAKEYIQSISRIIYNAID